MLSISNDLDVQEKFLGLIGKYLNGNGFRLNSLMDWEQIQRLIDDSLEPSTLSHYMATQANWLKESACLTGRTAEGVISTWQAEQKASHEREYASRYVKPVLLENPSEGQRRFGESFLERESVRNLV